MTARKHMFITGGARGIGLNIARGAGAEGYNLTLLGRNESALVDAAKGLRAIVGIQVFTACCDIGDSSAVGRAFAAAEQALGPVHVLVNNAGIGFSAPLAKTDEATWNQVLTVNLHGAFYCTRAALASMRVRKAGRIINIASTAGKGGARYTSAYAASKHALVGLTRAAAQEAAPIGITVNAVCPGWVDTDMASLAVANIANKTALSEDAAKDILAAMSPQNRIFEPQEVTDLVLFLASDKAKGINGTAIHIDGGMIPA